jgi:hypothetical protein
MKTRFGAEGASTGNSIWHHSICSPRSVVILVPAAVVLAVLLSACGGDPPEGTLVLNLTDSTYPFDLVRATEVLIDSVTVRIGNDTENGDAGFLTVDRTPRTVDLIELRNGISVPIGSALVPTGTIDQFRVYVGEATVTLTDDRPFPLTFPSGSSSGVKVFPSPPIEIGDQETVEVLLDFDLSESFSATPSSPRRVSDIVAFSFHPVLRVTNLTDVGAISGVVRDDAGTPFDATDDVPLPGAAVVAYQGTTVVTSTSTAVTGRYVLMGVTPGDHTVMASMSDGYGTASAEVTVEAARETAGVDLVLNRIPPP